MKVVFCDVALAQVPPAPGVPARLEGVPVPAPTPVAVLPQPIVVPPPVTVTPYVPFPQLPTSLLDETNNSIGIAQKLTRERGIQARILWMDATANLDKVNTAEKVAALVSRVRLAGFNTIVFEAKPIIGQVLYPSKYAPKMTEWVRPWKTQTLPLEFDPLREISTQAKAQGISFFVNLNAFSEGHREFPGKGPGDTNPQWQTVYYEPGLRLRRDLSGVPSYPLTDRPNIPARSPDDLAIYTDLSRWTVQPNALIALIDRTDTVAALVSGASLSALNLSVPPGGAAVIATTQPGQNFLRLNATPGYRMAIDNTPQYVPISQRPDRQVPLMTNPHNPEVRQRLLNIITEIVTGYEVDGIIFDDRLRYAALNADFSETTRREFETYVGKPLKWPDDVFRYEINFPTMNRVAIPGPHYEAWLVFRAVNLRNFVAEVVRTVKTLKPAVQVATYVGSWYPDYPDVGANWAAEDLQAGFRFLNDSYKKAGWANLVDFVTTGCYYENATIYEAAANGITIGETVEAAGQFSNRAVNDTTFVYAGLQLDKFKTKPEQFKRALQAAAASTQGIMVFDLSHDIDLFWPIFAEAFAKPAQAPHQVPGLLTELRTEKEKQKAAGILSPPVILYRGASGTGF